MSWDQPRVRVVDVLKDRGLRFGEMRNTRAIVIVQALSEYYLS
jgi:hypothetical protein